MCDKSRSAQKVDRKTVFYSILSQKSKIKGGKPTCLNVYIKNQFVTNPQLSVLKLSVVFKQAKKEKKNEPSVSSSQYQ